MECEKCNIRFIFYYTGEDTIKDIMDLLELNSNFKREHLSIYYKDGNSYFMEHEPVFASVANNGSENEMKLCIRALGGGKPRQTKPKKHMIKSEKLQKAQSDAQKVVGADAVNLKCIMDSNAVLSSFYTAAEKDPVDASLKQIEKLSKEHLDKALDSIKGGIGGTTEQKLKNFSLLCLEPPLLRLESSTKSHAASWRQPV